MTTANRKYKDSLFTNFFHDKERLIETYNAISGTDFPKTANVEFKTLENVLFRSQYNDIAFMIEDRFIVILEHQSSISANMPVRLLMYFSDICKGLVPQKPLYGGKLIPIPKPEFIVVYNGNDELPDKTILRLSDAFTTQTKETTIELVVTVYNINKGHNADILGHSASLSDYTEFVAYTRKMITEGHDREAAIDKAIHYCIKNGIMKVYLERESAEVKRMLITEWNDDEYREVILEEGIEKGMEKGIELGVEKGMEKGMKLGVEKGAEQKGLEIARKMKQFGIPVDKIAAITDLSADEIQSL